jgi:ATP-dependent Clp protease ATP-binding subunit ClpB
LDLIAEALQRAKEYRLIELSPEVLLEVILTKDTIVRNILLNLEIDLEGILNQIDLSVQNDPIKFPEDTPENEMNVAFSESFERLFNLAYGKVSENKDKYLALDILMIAGQQESFYKFLSPVMDQRMLIDDLITLRGDRKITEKSFIEQSFLNTYCENLNEKYQAGRLDEVHGRNEQVERISNVLAKRTKNNPILIGEPGTGKTAIVEGLAGRICEVEVENLKDAVIWSLDITALSAGAGGKGEIEARMNGLIKEIQRKNNMENEDIILFIDEIHLIVDPHGGMDLANILKPALARGELRTIGATTTKEYQKYFEKDPAIQRRFQTVTVDEPTVEETMTILRGLKAKMEGFHKVVLTDESMIAAAKLSKRYIADRFLPDKAIDLLDEAASQVSNSKFQLPVEIKEIQLEIKSKEFRIGVLNKTIEDQDKETFISKQKQHISELEIVISELKQKELELTENFMSEKELRKTYIDIKRQIAEQENQLKEELAESNIKAAFEIETKILPELRNDLEEIGSTFEKSTVRVDDIANVLFNWTGVPVDKIQEEEDKSKIKNIEKLLVGKVKGQEQATSAVSRTIRRNKAGLSPSNKPIGSFMFLGPTGVGKTETAKAISEIVFGDKDAMVRFDMSEFQQEHTVSKLIGSPAGYVGHDDGGQLTNAIKRKPYSVILFDELEKAHPKVFDVLLQVLDDGRLTDGKGITVDFKNTIIIFTSNIGGTELAAIPNEEVKKQEALRRLQESKMRPEFINRFDDIIVFNQLDIRALAEIMQSRIQELSDKLWNDRYIDLVVSDEAKSKMLSTIDIGKFGARPINRIIAKEIEDRLTDLILGDEVKAGSEVIIDIDNNRNLITTVV